MTLSSYASDMKREISAISLAPLNPVKEFTIYLPVAYWNTNEVEIFKITGDRLQSVAKSEPLPSLIRSVLLYNFGTDTSSKGENYYGYLLAGLADGSVASMTFKGAGLNELKITSLGTSPVLLTPCTVQQDGKETKTVLAAANRAAVFFVDRKRLLNSPVMLKVWIEAIELTDFSNSFTCAGDRCRVWFEYTYFWPSSHPSCSNWTFHRSYRES